MSAKRFIADYQDFRNDVLAEGVWTEEQVIQLFSIYLSTEPTNGVRESPSNRSSVRPMIQFTASHVPRGRPSIIDGVEL